MRRMVEKMMAQYGREMTLLQGGQQTVVRGFFQGVTGKAETLALPGMGPLGAEGKERFIYIGPAEPELSKGDRVCLDGKKYLTRSTQVIWGLGEPVYCWAMCVEEGGEDLWGSNG